MPMDSRFGINHLDLASPDHQKMIFSSWLPALFSDLFSKIFPVVYLYNGFYTMYMYVYTYFTGSASLA